MHYEPSLSFLTYEDIIRERIFCPRFYVQSNFIKILDSQDVDRSSTDSTHGLCGLLCIRIYVFYVTLRENVSR